MNPLPTRTRICLVDDDECILDSLEALFKSRRLRVSVFSDPARFLSIWQSSELREVPATFVIDIAMPGLSGIELFARMRAQGLPAHNAVIFLTGHGDIPQAVEAMRHGAFDFIEKPFSDNSLVDRVLESAAVVERAYGRHEVQARLASELSEREREVAQLVAQGLTNREIAARLAAGVRTVEAHRSRVFEKFGVRNAVSLAMAMHHGGCMPPAGDAACAG
jgi:two-component system response regulator DctR